MNKNKLALTNADAREILSDLIKRLQRDLPELQTNEQYAHHIPAYFVEYRYLTFVLDTLRMIDSFTENLMNCESLTMRFYQAYNYAWHINIPCALAYASECLIKDYTEMWGEV